MEFVIPLVNVNPNFRFSKSFWYFFQIHIFSLVKKFMYRKIENIKSADTNTPPSILHVFLKTTLTKHKTYLFSQFSICIYYCFSGDFKPKDPSKEKQQQLDYIVLFIKTFFFIIKHTRFENWRKLFWFTFLRIIDVIGIIH